VTPYPAAVAWIDCTFSPLDAERIPVAAGCGRVLAEDVAAAKDMPAADRAVEAGWAVEAEPTTGAGPYNPLVVAACRVAAGAPLPEGSDAVVPEALAQPLPDGNSIEIIEPVVAGALVERRGEDCRQGTTLLRAGHRLRPADLGLLAGGGRAEVAVVRRPCVRLAAARAPLAAMLQAFIQRDGGVAGADGEAADLLLAAGAAPPAAIAIDGIALRPGGAVVLGHAGGTALFSLPEIPVHCLWAYEMLAGRAVRRLAGLPPDPPFARRRLTAARKLVSAVGFTDIWPVRRVGEDGIEPAAGGAPAGAGLFATLAQADGFVVIPPASEGCSPGTAVWVYLYQGRNG
jgi:molybdopterin molybdotransferase